MELFRNVVFLLTGVVVTYNVLDVTPRDEWLLTTVILGLALTAVLVVVEVVFRLITRRRGNDRAATALRESTPPV